MRKWVVFLFALASVVAWAQDSIEHETAGYFTILRYDWTADASGDATGVTSEPVRGLVYLAVTTPGTGDEQPTDNYDIVVKERYTAAGGGSTVLLPTDVCSGALENRDDTNTERADIWPDVWTQFGGYLQIEVSNAGASNEGAIELHVYRTVAFKVYEIAESSGSALPTGGTTAQMLQNNGSGVAKWITLSGDVTVADGGTSTLEIDTEAEVESHLTDVTDVVTNNDTNYTYMIDSAGSVGQIWRSDGSGAGAWNDFLSLGLLTDPGADRIFFWDDSAGASKFLTVGTGLDVTGTTLSATGGGSGGGGSEGLWSDEGAYISPQNNSNVFLRDEGAASALVVNTFDNTTTHGIGALIESTDSTPGSQIVQAVEGHAIASTDATGNGDSYTGVYGAGVTGTSSTSVGLLRGVRGVLNMCSGSSAADAACFYADTRDMYGTVTNLYGLYVDEISAGTNNWAIYTTTGKHRLGGDTHIQGNLTVSGTYPGGGSSIRDTLWRLKPAEYEPPSSNYATLDTRNDRAVLDFDDDTDETAYWPDVLPERYGGTGVTVEIVFAMTSATTGNVVWAAAFEDCTALDLDGDSFATAQTDTQAVSGTCGQVAIASIAFTDGAEMDSLDAGDYGRLSVMRDADNESDTATGDAEVLIVHVKETGS